MEVIYKIISDSPEYFLWIFGLVNVLWGLFVYFNKQSHDEKMENIKHSLSLDLEKRKNHYGMKSREYESYVQKLDEYGRKYQIDLPKEMEPINDKYFKEIFKASMAGDQELLAQVTTDFGKSIGKILHNSLDDYLKIQAESNKLKLTASEQMLTTFNELESLMKATFDSTSELVSNYSTIIGSSENDVFNSHMPKLQALGDSVRIKKQQLLDLMREELNAI